MCRGTAICCRKEQVCGGKPRGIRLSGEHRDRFRPAQTHPLSPFPLGSGRESGIPQNYSACARCLTASSLAAYMLAFSAPALNILSASVCAALLHRTAVERLDGPFRQAARSAATASHPSAFRRLETLPFRLQTGDGSLQKSPALPANRRQQTAKKRFFDGLCRE